MPQAKEIGPTLRKISEDEDWVAERELDLDRGSTEESQEFWVICHASRALARTEFRFSKNVGGKWAL